MESWGSYGYAIAFSDVSAALVVAVLCFYAFLGFCAAVLRLVELHKAELRYMSLMKAPLPKRLPRRILFQPRKDRNEYT